MSFGERLKERREALGLSRSALAEQLDVTRSAIGNYEIGVSFPKEDVLLRLFDILSAEPNDLFCDSFVSRRSLTEEERFFADRYQTLSASGKAAVQSMLYALNEVPSAAPLPPPRRVIPLYTSPAAAGYVSPIMGEDYEPLTVTDAVPPEAEFAVRIRGDSMEPEIGDGSIAYVHHAPVENGDVGIFCVDGDMFCKKQMHHPVVSLFN